MTEIVSSVERVSNILQEISAASREQASGAEQVNQAVTQMDEATQQNAGLVEEATAAARAMEDPSVQLSEAVAVFKFKPDGRRRADGALPAVEHRRPGVLTAAY